MSEALYTTKKEIAKRIEVLRMEISFLESIHTGCSSCDAFDGRGCKLAGGLMPPDEVQRNGCPAWVWDSIPFNLEAHDNL